MTDHRLDSFRPDAAERIPMPIRRPWLRIGVPAVIIAGVAALLLDAGWEAWRPRTVVVAVPVAVRTVQTTDERDRAASASDVVVQAPGWVEASPYETFVAALRPGIVAEILVLEGASVAAGEPVARLVDDDARIAVDRSRAEVARRRAAVAVAAAAVDAAETDLRELVAPDRRVAIAAAEHARLVADLAAFPARIAGLDASRAELTDEFERKSRLVEEGAAAEGPVARLGIRIRAIDAQLEATRLERDATAARLDAAAAELAAARRDRDLLVRERLAVATTAANLDAARAELAAAEATLADAELQFDRCTVVSPVDGVVIERLASPGSTVGPGPDPHSTHLLHLYDPEHLQVRADVPLADAARVGLGQPAEIVVDLLPDHVFHGEIVRFVHRADLAKNTVEAKVRILDPSPLLKPDMLARVRLLAGDDKPDDAATAPTRTVTRVFAPEAAIRDGTAWIVAARDGSRGVAEPRPIELGASRADGWVEIRTGLQPGDLVIVEGEPTAGSPIRHHEPLDGGPEGSGA